METNTTTVPEQPIAETTTSVPAAPSITLQDLGICINIIDVGAQRGAWRGNELQTIGELRSKLEAFVKANSPAPPKEEETFEAVEESEAPPPADAE